MAAPESTAAAVEIEGDEDDPYAWLSQTAPASPDSERHHTVCPKVPLKRNLVVFSAVCGWILKPFELQIVLECGFDMMYDMAQ